MASSAGSITDSARLEPSRPRRMLPASWDRSAALAAEADAAAAFGRGGRAGVVPVVPARTRGAPEPGAVRGSFVADGPAARGVDGVRGGDPAERGLAGA
ncbi:hypothetical protein [Arthrobacter antioxidans]|uniref:hypothetical protein n=1 Tax=Arthrobacter antioxidans TaxID=2895818 RepID=UPI001FFF104B|nr:hypothetical protein [Arthrobacter antioxidans]